MNEVGRTLSWDALDSFVRELSIDSATCREIKPELSEWDSRTKTNAILADIYDIISKLNANVVALATGKGANVPEPYPRPDQEQAVKQDNKRHYGSDAIPACELHEWIEEKRREHGRNG